MSVPTVTFTSLDGKAYSSQDYDIQYSSYSEENKEQREYQVSIYDKDSHNMIYKQAYNSDDEEIMQTFNYDKDNKLISFDILSYTGGYGEDNPPRAEHFQCDEQERLTTYSLDYGNDSVIDYAHYYNYADDGSYSVHIDSNGDGQVNENEKLQYYNSEGKLLVPIEDYKSEENRDNLVPIEDYKPEDGSENLVSIEDYVPSKSDNLVSIEDYKPIDTNDKSNKILDFIKNIF